MSTRWRYGYRPVSREPKALNVSGTCAVGPPSTSAGASVIGREICAAWYVCACCITVTPSAA